MINDLSSIALPLERYMNESWINYDLIVFHLPKFDNFKQSGDICSATNWNDIYRLAFRVLAVNCPINRLI